jgi:glutathione S-transferase
MRDEGKFPFNQVPILILDNGAVIAQSGAILRYIGTLAGLYPRDNLELSAVIDSLFDQHQDMMMGVNGSRFPDRIGFGCVTADQIPFVRKSLQEEILPQHFQFFENFLAKSTTGWLASTPDPTIADFAFVARLELFLTPSNQLEGITPEVLTHFPLCRGLVQKLHDLPQVKEYYASKQKK